jgi:hypothetical protein
MSEEEDRHKKHRHKKVRRITRDNISMEQLDLATLHGSS